MGGESLGELGDPAGTVEVRGLRGGDVAAVDPPRRDLLEREVRAPGLEEKEGVLPVDLALQEFADDPLVALEVAHPGDRFAIVLDLERMKDREDVPRARVGFEQREDGGSVGVESDELGRDRLDGRLLEEVAVVV